MSAFAAYLKSNLFIFGVAWLVTYVVLWLHHAICLPLYVVPQAIYRCGGYSHFLADHDPLQTVIARIEGFWLVLLSFGISASIFAIVALVTYRKRKGSTPT